jgi:lipopolysaccharide export system permease protein
VSFGILQRYVLGEVIRACALALLTMTIIFVLFMVMAEAAKLGLSPRDIVTLIPYVIPGTLAYTAPVSLLFAVSVVYGRLASDNEIIAVKTAGLSAWTMIWPSVLMGTILSIALCYFSQDAIPRANHLAKLVIFRNFEEAFYKWLKMEREFNNPEWPFQIKVRDVDLDTKVMQVATFKHRNKKDVGPPFDMIVQARRARIKFDMEKGVAHVYLDGANITTPSSGTKQGDYIMINDRELDIDIPDKDNKGYEKKTQEWTTAEMVQEQAKFRRLIARERKKQAMDAALKIASGRIIGRAGVNWTGVQRAFIDYGFWTSKINEYETEKQLRVAQSFGSLMFVILGAPVGIIFARRDFLSAFITCFVPIMLLYYPLMLLGVNLGKDDLINPIYALWGSNMLLFVLSWFAIPPVIKH